jgi:uncharacterized protein (DUF1697 family)
MTRYVALLRGINVGGNKRIAMADLRALLSGLGYADVRTHLQSGNAVLTATGTPDRITAAIEERIAAELGMSVSVLVRDAAEMRRIVEANPLADVALDDSRYVVLFLSRPLDPELVAALDPAAYAPELFRVAEREVYLWHPDGIRDAKMNKINWERRFGVVASARNWRTVTTLTDMVVE